MGSGAETTLRILADASQVTTTFKKVGDEWKAVADKSAKSMGTMSAMISGMPKGLFSVAAAVAAIGTAAKAVNDIMSVQREWAERKNSLATATGSALLRAGGDQKHNEAFIGSRFQALTTKEGRAKFLESIAGLQEERRAKGMPAMKTADINRLEDLYNKGGNFVTGEGGADLIDSARQFPFNPELGFRRRLAGRTGTKLGSQSTEDLINLQLSHLPKAAQLALAQEKVAEKTRRGQEDSALTGQGVLAADEAFKQWQTENAGTIKGWAGTTLVPEGASRAKFAKQGAEELKAMLGEVKKAFGRQGNPTLPNMGARGNEPPGALGH